MSDGKRGWNETISYLLLMFLGRRYLIFFLLTFSIILMCTFAYLNATKSTFSAVVSYSFLAWFVCGVVHMIIRSYVLSTFEYLVGHPVKFKYLISAYRKANDLPIYDQNNVDRFIGTMVDDIKNTYRELKMK